MPPSPLPHLAPRLAPGLRVVRRGRDRLQVGLDPARRVVVPRDRATLRLLGSLLGDADTTTDGQPDAAPDTRVTTVLARLDDLGMLAAPHRPHPAVRLLQPTAAPWPVDTAPLLGPAPAGRAGGVLVLAVGEPDRAALDPLVRDGTPHLVVTLVDGGARLGPLVVPGRTACLRCTDAHLAADDPEHLAVLARYADPVSPTAPGSPDPALAALVTGWATRDLTLYLQRAAAPATWSTTLVWHPGSTAPTSRRWLRHPGCGCGWSSYADPPSLVHRDDASGARPSGTMDT